MIREATQESSAHRTNTWYNAAADRVIALVTDLKEAVGVAYLAGLCPDRAPNEVKLPRYQQRLQYDAFLPMNVDRMCLYWRNGWQ